jgi:hypothetical protein
MTTFLFDGVETNTDNHDLIKAWVSQFCDRLGIPYAERYMSMSWEGRVSWDGRTLPAASDWVNFLHDACHYIVSTPDQRALPNFGLGCYGRDRDRPVDGTYINEVEANVLTEAAIDQMRVDLDGRLFIGLPSHNYFHQTIINYAVTDAVFYPAKQRMSANGFLKGDKLNFDRLAKATATGIGRNPFQTFEEAINGFDDVARLNRDDDVARYDFAA